MSIVYSKTSNPFDSHTEGLVEYYGWVSSGGAIQYGGFGVTVGWGNQGIYTLSLNDDCAIYNSDFQLNDLTPKAWGTGVTKTAQLFITPLAPSLTATSDIIKVSIQEPAIKAGTSAPWFIINVIKKSPTGEPRYANCDFVYKIIVSTSKGGRY